MKHWKLNICALLLIGLLLRLGFWQIERGHEKQAMVAAASLSAKKREMAWSSSSSAMPQQYQNIRLKGQFLPQILLLDNQHHQHQFGYHVFSPFKIQKNDQHQKQSTPFVLIDRGWVSGDITRRNLPKIHVPKGTVSIQGQTYFPSKKQWSLGPDIEVKNQQVAVIETIHLKHASEFLKHTVYPFIVRLAPGQNEGFVCEWPVVSMPPERHFGYALQWFGLASVCFIFTVIMNRRSNRRRNTPAV